MDSKDFKLRQPEKLSPETLSALARLDSPLVDILGAWLNRRLDCAHCKRCARRCEVLELPALDIGLIEQHYAEIGALAGEQRAAATLRLTQEQPQLYHALRQCCFCGHCTATCAVHMAAPARMREWRELFTQAGLMPIDDSKIVMVDNEWHIFSAYRAIYGIAYPEFQQLPELAAAAGESGAAGAAGADTTAAGGAGSTDGANTAATEEAVGEGEASEAAGESGAAEADTAAKSEAVEASAEATAATAVDTLFFPGCSLISYAPELVRRIGQWLDGAGIRWALSDECCGSPLMSAGLFERSAALRHKVLEQIRAAGIKRVLTVCPGCGEELAEVMGEEVDIVPLPELMCAYLAENDVAAPCAEAGDQAIIRSSFTFFDSCHDRFDLRHGTAVRRLLELCFPQAPQLECAHHGRDTLCCGAGGAVAPYDPDISARRVWRVVDEARATGASTLVSTCPTCTYTIAQALLTAPQTRAAGLASHNYLELVFGQAIDWTLVFGQLEAMWSGEYGPWLAETFY
jgi:Fe-S oxidoreductase